MKLHYFDFETDFVEEGMRCIPMVVRMKLDEVGIKLTLRQWSRFSEDERDALAAMPAKTLIQRSAFDSFLSELIGTHCDDPIVRMAIHPFPEWKDRELLPTSLVQQAALYRSAISLEDWRMLKPLQRFALMKLCRPGHENRNFPIAMEEFGLLKAQPQLCEEREP